MPNVLGQIKWMQNIHFLFSFIFFFQNLYSPISTRCTWHFHIRHLHLSNWWMREIICRFLFSSFIHFNLFVANLNFSCSEQNAGCCFLIWPSREDANKVANANHNKHTLPVVCDLSNLALSRWNCHKLNNIPDLQLWTTLLYLINCQVTFVFADVKTVKPPYLDQKQHLQHLDAYAISNVAGCKRRGGRRRRWCIIHVE